MGDGSPSIGGPNQLIAARILRVLSWIQILVPLGAIVVTIPGSLFILLMGGVIIVAPPIALAVVGLGIARGLKAGRRIAARSGPNARTSGRVCRSRAPFPDVGPTDDG